MINCPKCQSEVCRKCTDIETSQNKHRYVSINWQEILSRKCSLFKPAVIPELNCSFCFVTIRSNHELWEQNDYSEVKIQWEGNTGTGTSSYRNETLVFNILKKPRLKVHRLFRWCDQMEPWRFIGRFACHKLWYLHLCAVNHIHVMSIKHLVLWKMQIPLNADSNYFKARGCFGKRCWPRAKLHEEAHHECMIANSVKLHVKPALVLLSN